MIKKTKTITDSGGLQERLAEGESAIVAATEQWPSYLSAIWLVAPSIDNISDADLFVQFKTFCGMLSQLSPPKSLEWSLQWSLWSAYMRVGT